MIYPSGMTLNRARLTWSGWTGAPGYSNFYFSSATTNMGALNTFFSTIENYLPNGVHVVVPSSGDQIDEAVGGITGTWTGTGGASHGGFAGSGNFSAITGFVCDWHTSLLVAGRRVLGKTFIVPCYPSAFDSTGQVASSTKTAVETAMATMISSYAGAMKVWTRPRVSIAGAGATITSGTVPLIPVQLTSRRQ